MVDNKKCDVNIPPCSVCDQKNVGVSFNYQTGNSFDEKLFEGLKIAFCEKCSLGEAFPQIDEDKLKAFYIQNYRSGSSAFYIKRSRSQPSADIRSLAQISLGRLFANNITTFLDLGPGAGGSFAAAQKLIRPERMYALELNEGAANQFSNFGVQTITSINDIDDAHQSIDFALASHFLEHLSYETLERLLRDLGNIMSKNGVFVVEVPHVDMNLHVNTRPLDSPHLLFFSLKSLTNIFSSQGWEVLFANTCGPFYDANQSKYHATGFLDGLIKGLFRFACPRSVQEAVRAYRFMLSDQNAYGNNRQCVRLVAKKIP